MDHQPLVQLFLILSAVILFSCSHAKPHEFTAAEREYKDVNFEKLYQKDRSYDALNNDMTGICDRILNWSAENSELNENENKMLEGYIHQNHLFEQPGFDKQWLLNSKQMFERAYNDEQNKIAPAIYNKIKNLYAKALEQSPDQSLQKTQSNGEAHSE